MGEILALFGPEEPQRYRAEITVVNYRDYQIYAVAVLTPDQVKRFTAVIGEDVAVDDEVATELAQAFGFATKLENLQSDGPLIRIDALEIDNKTPIGAYNIADEPLTHGGDVQPHIGGALAAYVRGGETLSGRYYRDASCLVVAVFEATYEAVHERRSTTHPLYASHEAMYRFITGRRVAPGDPMPLSLRQAEKAFRELGIKVTAIDHLGRVVYRYAPATAQRRGKVLRLYVKNNHCWIVNDNIESFDHKYGNADVVDVAPLAGDLSAAMSPLWSFAGKKPSPVIAVCDTAFGVSEAIRSACNAAAEDKGPTDVRVVVHASADVETVAIELREQHGLEPAGLSGVHGAVDSFGVCYRFGGQVIKARVARGVDRAALTDDQPVPEAAHVADINRVNTALARVVGSLTNRAALSTWSTGAVLDLENFHRGPRSGFVDMAPVEDEAYLCIDQGRAYTGHLATMKVQPVFSVFDNFRPVDQEAAIEPHARYLVKCLDRDQILLEKRVDVLFGFSVDYARQCGRRIELLGVMKPHRFAATSIAGELRALYTDESLSDQDRKAIGCIAYGQASKRAKTAQRAEVFSGEDEARAHGGDVRKFGKGFISMRRGKKSLREGFAYTGAHVLEQSRIALHRMVVAIRGAGVPCIAVRTDCVYVRLADGDTAKEALRGAQFRFASEVASTASLWDRKVGVLRCEEKVGAFLPKSALKLDTRTDRVSPPVTNEPKCHRAFLPSETPRGWDNDELDAQMPTGPAATQADVDALIDDVLEGREIWWLHNPELLIDGQRDNVPIAFEALVPGAGKSYSVEDYARRHRLVTAMLIVCPWNRLSCEKSRGGFSTATLYRLLGRNANGAEGEADDKAKTRKPHDLTGIRHVHFEEPYLYTVRELEWVRTFMLAHPDLAFTMAGDPCQLRPVGQTLAVDADKYYEMIFAELFPRRLTLQYNKRCSTPEEGRKMEAICAELRSEASPVVNILAKHGLRTIDFEDLTEADARVPHITATRGTVARVNAWAHPIHHPDQPDAYLPGQTLLGQGGGLVQGGRLNPNELYTIVECDDKRLTITNIHGKSFRPTMRQVEKLLRRPYATTNHAVQGLSLGDRLFIHEADHWMADHRWMRTAVSRCGTLDITLVRHGRHADHRARNDTPDVDDGCDGLCPGCGNNYDACSCGDQPSAHKRVEAHRQADHGRFAYDPDSYVSLQWVHEQLVRQKFACTCCGEDLGNARSGRWSIDRISNMMAHTQDNSTLVCHVRSGNCQAMSAQRRD